MAFAERLPGLIRKGFGGCARRDIPRRTVLFSERLCSTVKIRLLKVPVHLSPAPMTSTGSLLAAKRGAKRGKERNEERARKKKRENARPADDGVDKTPLRAPLGGRGRRRLLGRGDSAHDCEATQPLRTDIIIIGPGSNIIPLPGVQVYDLCQDKSQRERVPRCVWCLDDPSRGADA